MVRPRRVASGTVVAHRRRYIAGPGRCQQQGLAPRRAPLLAHWQPWRDQRGGDVHSPDRRRPLENIACRLDERICDEQVVLSPCANGVEDTANRLMLKKFFQHCPREQERETPSWLARLSGNGRWLRLQPRRIRARPADETGAM